MKVILISLGLFALIIQKSNPESSLSFGVDTSLPNAVQGQFPWQMFIYDNGRYIGSGSIISDSWVLTVATNCFSHCSLTLKFGTVKPNDSDAVTMTSADLHVHPEYKHQRNSNNICLIKLPNPLTFSTQIAAIKLISSDQEPNTFIDHRAAISGFGALAHNETMSWGEVQIVEKENCSGYFSQALQQTSFCVEGNENTASHILFCRTEFGIPIIVQDNDGRWVQIGIKSVKAHDRCHAGSYSIYQKLTPFLGYIRDTTGILNI